MKRIFALLVCLVLVLTACSNENEQQSMSSDFFEPSNGILPFPEYSVGTDGRYTPFADFAVDFPGGWYKDRNKLVCQGSTLARYIEIGETEECKNAEKAFKKLDEEYSGAVYSEEMTLGGYPAKKYIVLNPNGKDDYIKYVYNYHIFLDGEMVRLSYYPGLTEGLKEEREYIETYLDTIHKMTTDYPESLYDMDAENFLNGENKKYIDSLLKTVVGTVLWKTATDPDYKDYAGFDSAAELDADFLMNVYFCMAEDHSDMYKQEDGTYLIPQKDIYYVLDKYFENYRLDFKAAGFKTYENSLFLEKYEREFWGANYNKKTEVFEAEEGTLKVEITFSTPEENKTAEVYTFFVRPDKNKCIVQSLDIECFE